MIFGFVWYATMHVLMTFAALGVISVYAVPITLLILVVIFIVVTVMFRKKAGV